MKNLDRYVKIGSIRLPRWIAGRDAWDGETENLDGPVGGYIIHQAEPRFVARWCIGEAPHLSALIYSDAAQAGEDDADDITLYDFVWTDEMPDEEDFRLLMRSAIDALDNFIGALNAEYE